MSEHFDAVVIGAGPGGEVVAGRLLDAGRRVAIVERELIGGECAYWACIPSKTLLRSAEIAERGRRTPGATSSGPDWTAAAAWRDRMIRGLDDSKQHDGYAERGATVLRGEGRITGFGEVTVEDRVLTCDHIVVATGSEPAIPPVPGLERDRVWTNREATTAADPPGRAAIVGGGPVGCEIAQYLRRFGSAITIVEHADRLLPGEDPGAAAALGRVFEAEGIDVRTGARIDRVDHGDEDHTIRLAGGEAIACDVVIAATGRKPRTTGLGLDAIGLDIEPGGPLTVDEHCRAADGVWAVGDVTGIMPFTHVAKYQGRLIADAILGETRAARYDGVPRAVFTDPEVAAVGLTEDQARERGLRTVATELDLTEALARPWTYEEQPIGMLGLRADRDKRTLVGAWAVAPAAAEWIHVPAMAVRLGTGIDDLRDQIAQFPTYSEGLQAALSKLDLD